MYFKKKRCDRSTDEYRYGQVAISKSSSLDRLIGRLFVDKPQIEKWVLVVVHTPCNSNEEDPVVVGLSQGSRKNAQMHIDDRVATD